ncbi:hypothetical protein ZIOFF_048528 [Zingiber officinale]|uniref:Oleosin n=2 Tax=Zingiber officinale TaxID=94328 RepID=A0A8J5FZE5_ZINOF|nr:hypothetical protein ZIOFF_048528 [Zingiber officinale]
MQSCKCLALPAPLSTGRPPHTRHSLPLLYQPTDSAPSAPKSGVTKCSAIVDTTISMGDRDRHQQQPPSEAIKSLLPDKGPSGPQALAVAILLPVGGSLLALSCLTLVGSLIGLAVLTPVFLLFSPVLVPAALLAALAVAGFLGSGALGLAGLSSLGYLLRKASALVQQAAPEQVEQVRRRMGEVGQKAKDAAQGRAEESKRT